MGGWLVGCVLAGLIGCFLGGWASQYPDAKPVGQIVKLSGAQVSELSQLTAIAWNGRFRAVLRCDSDCLRFVSLL